MFFSSALPEHSEDTATRANLAKGGVAFIFDASLKPAILQQFVFVPGYAIGILVAGAAGGSNEWIRPHLICAIYCPPDAKCATLRAFHTQIARWKAERRWAGAIPIILIGDVNFAAPGTPGFSELKHTDVQHELDVMLDGCALRSFSAAYEAYMEEMEQ